MRKIIIFIKSLLFKKNRITVSSLARLLIKEKRLQRSLGGTGLLTCDVVGAGRIIDRYTIEQGEAERHYR